MTKLWRIVGTSKGGNPVTLTVLSSNYFKARQKAAQLGITIRDIVLQESSHDRKNQKTKANDEDRLSQRN
jgi:hypothetical protein